MTIDEQIKYLQSCIIGFDLFCDDPYQKIMFEKIKEHYDDIIESLKALKQILNPNLDYHVAVFKKDEQLEFIKFKEMQYNSEVLKSKELQHD